MWWKLVFTYIKHKYIFHKKIIYDFIVADNNQSNRRLKLLILNLFHNKIFNLSLLIFWITTYLIFINIISSVLFIQLIILSSKFKINHLLKYLILFLIPNISINNFWFQNIDNLRFENILLIAESHVICFLLDFYC